MLSEQMHVLREDNSVTALSMFHVRPSMLPCHRLLNHEDRANDVHPRVSHE